MFKKAIKEILVFLAVLVIATLASPLHAYWAERVEAPKTVERSNTLVIGTANQVQERIVIIPPEENTQILVPSTRTRSILSNPNVTGVLRYSFAVEWKTDAPVKASANIQGIPYILPGQPNAPGQLGEPARDILRVCPATGDCTDTFSNYFNVTVTPERKPIILNGDPVRFDVEVEMREPETRQAYESIKNQALKIIIGKVAIIRLDTFIANGHIPSEADWGRAYDRVSGIRTRP